MTHVVITSAIGLSSEQLEKIKNAISKKYGQDVTYLIAVDPSILGGVQLTINSRLLDGSIKGKIEQLKKQIRNEA